MVGCAIDGQRVTLLRLCGVFLCTKLNCYIERLLKSLICYSLFFWAKEERIVTLVRSVILLNKLSAPIKIIPLLVQLNRKPGRSPTTAFNALSYMLWIRNTDDQKIFVNTCIQFLHGYLCDLFSQLLWNNPSYPLNFQPLINLVLLNTGYRSLFWSFPLFP